MSAILTTIGSEPRPEALAVLGLSGHRERAHGPAVKAPLAAHELGPFRLIADDDLVATWLRALLLHVPRLALSRVVRHHPSHGSTQGGSERCGEPLVWGPPRMVEAAEV